MAVSRMARSPPDPRNIRPRVRLHFGGLNALDRRRGLRRSRRAAGPPGTWYGWTRTLSSSWKRPTSRRFGCSSLLPPPRCTHTERPGANRRKMQTGLKTPSPHGPMTPLAVGTLGQEATKAERGRPDAGADETCHPLPSPAGVETVHNHSVPVTEMLVPRVCQLCSNLGQVWPGFGEIWPMSYSIWSNSPQTGWLPCQCWSMCGNPKIV